MYVATISKNIFLNVRFTEVVYLQIFISCIQRKKLWQTDSFLTVMYFIDTYLYYTDLIYVHYIMNVSNQCLYYDDALHFTSFYNKKKRLNKWILFFIIYNKS